RTMSPRNVMLLPVANTVARHSQDGISLRPRTLILTTGRSVSWQSNSPSRSSVQLSSEKIGIPPSRTEPRRFSVSSMFLAAAGRDHGDHVDEMALTRSWRVGAHQIDRRGRQRPAEQGGQ